MTARRLIFSRAGLALAALLLPVVLLMASAGQSAAQDASEFFLRLNRLENQVREMSGTVEKLEFENRRLQEQLKRFQEDVEFRFQESSGAAPAKQKRSDITPADPRSDDVGGTQQVTQTTTPAQPASSISAGRAAESAFPDGAAGEEPFSPPVLALPRIDTPAMSTPLEPGGAGAPLDLGAVGLAATPQAPEVPDTGVVADIPSVAATSPGDPQAGFRNAEASLRRQDFAAAEMEFREFLQSHPRDRLTPEATFLLGESYFFRGRYREAAEQYLRVTTAFPNSPRAPEGMLRLGISLDALGARDQACATLAETLRKYPNAGPEVREGVARARARCA
ncbi:tol-pal system protein YbgF [Pseudochelatococcus contaminans]|uniref:Cell division coordinator CpoB n=1 Tax=Pseudochelatococcus contaminans TaxID=1538103 RepID=A0A7W5Z2S2_9HYPH|nr:tol-pal system protein YbgF [Pseudochelatococcus contaminans]MBB3809051.1 tol-pal system protein YbgF [Pseudochelatococcus contaminans]